MTEPFPLEAGAGATERALMLCCEWQAASDHIEDEHSC